MVKIEKKELNTDELKSKYEQALKDLNDYKENTIAEREKELLELYLEEIIGDSEEIQKWRRRAIKNVKKSTIQIIHFWYTN